MLCSRVFQRRERVCPAFVSCVLTHSVGVLNMNREEIIKLAREAGLKTGVNVSGVTLVFAHVPGVKIAHITLEELERFAALVAAAEREAIRDEYASRLQSDLEHGVKWLNGAACDEFKKKYAELSGFLQWLNDRGDKK